MSTPQTRVEYLSRGVLLWTVLAATLVASVACNDRRGSGDGFRNGQADSGVDERSDGDADSADDASVTPGDVAEDAENDAPSDADAEMGVDARDTSTPLPDAADTVDAFGPDTPDVQEDVSAEADAAIDADVGSPIGQRACLPGELHEYRLPEGVRLPQRANRYDERLVVVDVDGDGDEDVLYTSDDVESGFWLERRPDGFELAPHGELGLEGVLLAARQVPGIGLVVVMKNERVVNIWTRGPAGVLQRADTDERIPRFGEPTGAAISESGVIYITAGGLWEATLTAGGVQFRALMEAASGRVVVDDARGVLWTWTPVSGGGLPLLTRIAFDEDEVEALQLPEFVRSDGLQLLLRPAWRSEPAELVVLSFAGDLTPFRDATPLESLVIEHPRTLWNYFGSSQVQRDAATGEMIIVAAGTRRIYVSSGRSEPGIPSSLGAAFASDAEYEALVAIGHTLSLIPHNSDLASRLHEIPDSFPSTWMGSADPTQAGLVGPSSSLSTVNHVARWPASATRTQPDSWTRTVVPVGGAFGTGLVDESTDGAWPYLLLATGNRVSGLYEDGSVVGNSYSDTQRRVFASRGLVQGIRDGFALRSLRHYESTPAAAEIDPSLPRWLVDRVLQADGTVVERVPADPLVAVHSIVAESEGRAYSVALSDGLFARWIDADAFPDMPVASAAGTIAGEEGAVISRFGPHDSGRLLLATPTTLAVLSVTSSGLAVESSVPWEGRPVRWTPTAWGLVGAVDDPDVPEHGEVWEWPLDATGPRRVDYVTAYPTWLTQGDFDLDGVPDLVVLDELVVFGDCWDDGAEP